ncbi:MAG: GNAT family N-acetyltransferase [Mobilitalea sp.]
MKRRIFNIFKECFNDIPITEDIFYSLFEYEQCELITKYNQNEMIGFSAVRGNCIVLLCVAPEFQRKGFGTQLVTESEQLIKKNAYDSVIIGGTHSKLFLGAITEEKEWNQRHNYFFEKCGYTADNGCLEMVMSIKNYCLDNVNTLLNLPNITFKYWNKEDKSDLLFAVTEVDEDWVKYYEYDIPIYVAMEQGKCVGFTILSYNDITLCSNGHNNVGKVGCVGVIPSKRNCGIGIALVAYATNELKKNGCDESYIHYTYLDKWYGKLGYKPIFWYWFGKKIFSIV